jgi:hypothetical protein
VAVLMAHGIEAALPSGFEGRIFVRATQGAERSHPVAHFATFPLPRALGDFGAGVVTLMGHDDVFAVLFEYGPESVGRTLFSLQGMPRALEPRHFRPYTIRRGISGQSGSQWFFTESGRAFTLYAVLGSHDRRHRLVPRLNELLAGTTLHPHPVAVWADGTERRQQWN